MRGTFLSTFLLLTYMTATGYAFQNEPTGFGGLKWGDPMPADFQEIDSQTEGGVRYVFTAHAGDVAEFVGLEFDGVYYTFADGRLIEVLFTAPLDQMLYKTIRRALIADFGPPNVDTPEQIIWEGAVSDVILDFDRDNEELALILSPANPAN